MAFLGTFRHVLLATAIDPIAVQIQGIPVSKIGKIFSIITAIVVVSMVQFVGALLVTALLVTPAATSRIVSRSFRSCIIWAQLFGLSSTIIGIYASAELRTGTGYKIDLTSASIFLVVALIQVVILPLLRTDALAR